MATDGRNVFRSGIPNIKMKHQKLRKYMVKFIMNDLDPLHLMVYHLSKFLVFNQEITLPSGSFLYSRPIRPCSNGCWTTHILIILLKNFLSDVGKT